MRSLVTLLCLAATLVSTRSAFAEDWLEFRGPGGLGHSLASGLPTKWSEGENVVWKEPIPGKGWSSPVIVGGKVFLTTAVPTGEDELPAQSLRALSLDAKTGKIDWDIELFQMAAGRRVHGKNSHASSSPICDGKRIYVHFGTDGTACLERDGTVVWKTNELKYAPVHGNGGSPVLFEDLLILNCDGADTQFAVALECPTGKIRWKRDRGLEPDRGFSFCTPLLVKVDGETQLISSGSDAVFGLSPTTGEEIWRVRYKGGYSVVPRPVFGHDMVYVCTGFNTPVLLAIRVPGAKGDVTETHVAWKLTKKVPLDPSPLVVGDDLYLVSDDGILTCCDAKSGDVRWTQRLGGAYWASPTFADGRIYIQSEQGETIVIEPGAEYREIARSNVGEQTFASYAIADKAIFLRSEKLLWRLQSMKTTAAQ